MIKLLITKEVEVNLHSSNVKYYEDLGYPIPRRKDKKGRFVFPRGSTIIVKIKDLQLKSNVDIDVKCDYCGNEFKRRYADHTYIHIKNNNVDTDACEECANLKFKEVYFLKYGVDNPFSQEEIKQKIVNTINEKYGVNNIMDLKEYRLKIANTLSKNNTVSTSKQQIYLHKLIGGELNYVNNTPILDIAFPNEMIYVEYDGGGHDLKVKLGIMSNKEFKKREIKRYYFLNKKGWKGIRIISSKDLLPFDKKILEMIKYANNYLETEHSWIEFNIDNQLVNCSQYEQYYDFGELRKIKDKDLEIC